jgi:hypothetical protein
MLLPTYRPYPKMLELPGKKLAGAKHYSLLRHNFIDEEKHSYQMFMF